MKLRDDGLRDHVEGVIRQARRDLAEVERAVERARREVAALEGRLTRARERLIVAARMRGRLADAVVGTPGAGPARDDA